MTVGTRSLLWGVHAFWWHPLTVLLAWIKLYGIRSLNWRLLICIFIHDWGYWGCSSIEGRAGRKHPEGPARWADSHLGPDYGREVLFHSRYYVANLNQEADTLMTHFGEMPGKPHAPSRLCWADKASINYDPCRFYLLRARLSGELLEYRHVAHMTQAVRYDKDDREWYWWIRQHANELVVREST